jgi:hypothetical protein
MKIPIRALMIATILSLTACNSAKPGNERPDWVNGNPSQYPASAYLTGHGQSDNMATAKDAARGDLAKNFSVNVSEQSSDTSTYSQGDANGTPTAKNSLDVSRNIKTRTDQMLTGVEISQTWQDPQSQQYYALATLSRAKAGNALRQQIGDLDAGTAASLSQAQNSTDLFDKIAAATQAVDSQQTRTGLQKELQVVDPSGMGIPSSWSLAKLQADRSALLKQLQITPAADGRDADATKKVLAGALSDSGFTVADGANYTMTANLDYSDMPQGDWIWITGTLQVTMNGNDSRAHGVRRWEIKVSGSNKELAQQRLMDQVAQDLQTDIQGTVLAFASGRQP